LESVCVLVLQVGVCAIARLADSRGRNHNRISLFILFSFDRFVKNPFGGRTGTGVARLDQQRKQRKTIAFRLRSGAHKESWGTAMQRVNSRVHLSAATMQLVGDSLSWMEAPVQRRALQEKEERARRPHQEHR
jgi:hypothetical protein